MFYWVLLISNCHNSWYLPLLLMAYIWIRLVHFHLVYINITHSLCNLIGIVVTD